MKYEFRNLLCVEFYNGDGAPVGFSVSRYNFRFSMFSCAGFRHSGDSISALETYQPGLASIIVASDSITLNGRFFA